MELRVLNYFLTVAQEKNISQAATVLHISQPTLSKQLKDLEEELGVTLFIRGNRQITLTEEGEYLNQRGKEILSLVHSTTNNLMKDNVIGGELAIGSGETRGFELIAQIIGKIQHNYPLVTCHLYSGNADAITRKIDDGLLDFGVVIDPVQKNKYDFVQLPHQETWGVLVNKQHPLAKHSSLSPEKLLSIPLFVSNQTMVDNQMREWLGHNQKLNVIGTYNLLFNASLLCQNTTIGVLCIDGIINTNQTNLRFIKLSPILDATINLIWKKGTILSNTAKLFLEEIYNTNY